jgi:predicted nucleic acid-binding protein
MITALDTNVILDVFAADPSFGEASRRAIRACRNQGGLVACEVVWTEVAAAFPDVTQAAKAMDGLGVRFVPADPAAALDAGQAWRSYRRAGGTRQRVVPDFLIGSHAIGHADRLLTRDRGFYRNYFAKLTVLDPTDSEA